MFRKMINGWAKRQALVTLVFLVFLIVYPLIFKSYYLRNIALQCLLYSMLSLALNFIMGYTGIVVLGMAAFYGIGAYTLAILSTRFGFSFVPATFCAMLTAFIAGILIGLPTLRIQGNYLAIVTLGFCEIIRIVELNWVQLTNGPFGIKQIPAPNLFGIDNVFGLKLSTPLGKYYLLLVLLALVVVCVHNMLHSRPGRAWKAIKGDPVAAQAMGINVFRYKVFAFAICAAIAGLAGAFYASYINYVDSTTFNYNQSIQILSMTIMGGLGSIPGSIIGAAFFVVLPEFLRWLGTFLGEWILEWRQIIYGVILVVMIMFKSDGILGGFDLRQIHLYNKLHKEKEAEGRAK